MSLLDQLWDETLAGPRPDKGLGKLRKQSTFTFRSSDSSKAESQAVEDPAMRVTRSIMIGKPVGNESQTPPASPAGSTPPGADRRHIGFVGSLLPSITRGQPGSDTGALVLLTTCEM
ncbi:dormancy-associated protein homolog 3 isoform X3 [Helianthus annuus]|uniref:dormancy-associated protein homolog 3 isoform X3 n=1 Tax=Helianthus annuus TaxID=4232 RepID=UPI000B8F51D3|nr:dormancy-associated protein homolog 3 isoform X3 [Helianthus annuus]